MDKRKSNLRARSRTRAARLPDVIVWDPIPGRARRTLAELTRPPTARAEPTPPEPSRDAAPEPRILVPVDFSPGARAAVRHAARLAERENARLRLLHVVEPPVEPEVRGQGLVALREVTEHAQARLAAMAAELPCAARVEGRVGDPVRVIEERAREVGADRIVMGARRTSPGPVGSVARAVSRRAKCPVTLVAARL